MNLHTLLAQRTEASGPVKVGVIGVGKFASMFLTQALNLTGIHVVGVADLAPDRARAALARTGWPEERYAAASFDEALKTGGTHGSLLRLAIQTGLGPVEMEARVVWTAVTRETNRHGVAFPEPKGPDFATELHIVEGQSEGGGYSKDD